MKKYPLFKVHIPEEALANISEVFESGYINEGAQVTALTQGLSDYLNAPHLVLTNSCTSALTMALKLAGVAPGDEVISTPMTCVATNTPIVNAGAKLVWADVDPRHGMLDPEDVVRRITPQTKAVMAVAWAGTPPNLFMLHKACKAMDVKLILDAAHAFDANYQSRPIHEWADYTTYSFQAIKHFTTGDGGALVCKAAEDYKKSKAMKWFGLDRDATKDALGNWKGQQWDADVEEAGFKFNMNNVAAAIGLAQLPHIDEVMDRHRANGWAYEDLLQHWPAVTLCHKPEGGQSSHWVYTLQVNPTHSRLTRDELLTALNEEGIMAGVVHVPNDAYTAFKGSQTDLPGVRQFSAYQFSLPCGWWITEEDVRHIVSRVKELTR